MKRLIILTIIAWFNLLTTSLCAQNASRQYIHAGKQGIYAEAFWLAVDHQLKTPLSFELQVKKRDGEKWKTVSAGKAAQDFETFKKNFWHYAALFPYYGENYDETAVRKVWNRYLQIKRQEEIQADVLKFELPFRLAMGVTLFWDVPEEGIYHCRIVVVNGTGKTVLEGSAETVSYPVDARLAKLVFNRKVVVRNGLKLFWKALGGGEVIGSYFVLYQQLTPKERFKQAGLTLWVNMTKEGEFVAFTDTLIGNRLYGNYYVESYDAYFNKGAVSDTVLVSNSNMRTFPMPDNFTVETDEHTGAVVLSWQLSNPSVVRTVDIYRGQYFNQPFTKIASIASSVTKYVDKRVKAGDKYYYYAQSSGYLNEKSLPTVKIYAYSKSDEKPIKPVGLTGLSINGGVLLKWPAGNSFIKGYFVFRNDGLSDSLMEVSGFIPNGDSVIRYTDTSRILSSKWFYAYAVKAVSRNSVLSDFSDTVKIRPQIKMDAPEPYGMEVLKKGNNLWIGWQNMLLHYNTVFGYKLKRVDKRTGDTLLLSAMIPNSKNFFLDTTADVSTSYRYGLQTLNFQSGESEIRWVEYSASSALLPPPLKIYITQSIDSVEINWSPVFSHRLSGYKIFRYKRGEQPVMVGKTGTDKTSLILTKPGKGLWFFYVVSTDGLNDSPQSDEVYIRIRR